jgi:hypothetical protein
VDAGLRFYLAMIFRQLMMMGVILALRVDVSAASNFTFTADVERVGRVQEKEVIHTTRQVKVKLRNMSPTAQATAGIECWMFYRDLRTHQILLEHKARVPVTLTAGDWREVIADKQLFNYIPDRYVHGNHNRLGSVRRIPGSGHKYEGFVVRLYEDGKVTGQVSTSSSLTKIVDNAWQQESLAQGKGGL